LTANCAVGVRNNTVVSVAETPRVARGVGRPGEDEESPPVVGGSDVGSAYTRPARVIPCAGQVSDHTTCRPQRHWLFATQTEFTWSHCAIGVNTESTPHVLPHDERRV
jgi:hypothetical protein